MLRIKVIAFVAIISSTLIFQSCKEEPKREQGEIVVIAKFENLKDPNLLISAMSERTNRTPLKGENGEYEFVVKTKDLECFTIEDKNMNFYRRFMADYSCDTIKLFADANEDMKPMKVIGSKYEDDRKKYRIANGKFHKERGKTSAHDLFMKSYTVKTQKERDEVERQMKIAKAEEDVFLLKFMQDNPDNLQAIDHIFQRMTSKTGGESAKYLKKFVDCIKSDHPYAKKVVNAMGPMLQVETDVKEFVKDAANVKYKVDDAFKGKEHIDISYLVIFNDNNLCALVGKDDTHSMAAAVNKKLEPNFAIKVIDQQGNQVGGFKLNEEHSPNCIAVDDSKNIYVLINKTKTVKNKFRGQIVENKLSEGVICAVYDIKGNRLKEFPISNVKTASGARVNGDKLFISDVSSSVVNIYDKNTGELIKSIGGMRPCCSILDLDVTKDDQILVANLGSFRVDAFNLEGEKLVSFGERGKEINQFSGCCNPVSLRKLDNGCIITVEKTPTRIKVYSKEGASVIEGIDELVDGCYHIPVTSDIDNNIYLASPEKGLVKCVIK